MEEILEKISNGRTVTGKDIYTMIKFIFKRQFMLCHLVIASSLVVKTFNSVFI